jgi:hypothetical protein
LPWTRIAASSAFRTAKSTSPLKPTLLGLRKRSESRYDVFGAGGLNVLLPTAGEFARIADLRKAGRPAPRASLAGGVPTFAVRDRNIMKRQMP